VKVAVVLVVLYVVAFACEAIGVILLWVELKQGRVRWAELRDRPHRGYAVGATSREAARPVRADKEGASVESRLAGLERDLYQHRSDHVDLERDLQSHAKSEAEEAATRLREFLRPELTTLFDYLVGQEDRPRWRPWWLGPVVLFAGVLLGTAGNIASTAAS
jgi:hypothetical protein